MCENHHLNSTELQTQVTSAFINHKFKYFLSHNKYHPNYREGTTDLLEISNI